MELILTGYVANQDFFEFNKIQEDFENAILTNRDKPLEMIIASGGGSVIKGLEISALIKTHNQPTKAICVGFVASIATVIALSADKVVMDENATMLIHNASGGRYGTAEDLRQTADQLDSFSRQVMSYYVGRIAKNGKLINNNIQETEAFLYELMEEERILSAAECLQIGLVDKLINEQIPAQISDNSEALLQQIGKTYPTASAKFNFTNCFPTMKKEEQQAAVPQDKKGLFKAFTNAFAALFGFSNDAQPAAEEVAPQAEAEAETEPENNSQTQPEEQMTEEQMIQHLKEKGFDVSAKETPAPEVPETDPTASFKAEFDAMKAQLEALKAQSFENAQKPAGANETAADKMKAEKSALKQKVYAAIGNNLLNDFKKLSR